MAEAQDGDDGIQSLSGKPFFTVIVCPSHINPDYNLLLPYKVSEILPCKEMPVVLVCKGKEWKMVYSGGQPRSRFNTPPWKHFADDNELKVGDACIFELMECTERQAKFRVQILRGDIPPELQGRIRSDGNDLHLPLVIE